MVSGIIEGEKRILGPSHSVFMPAMVVHATLNIGTEDAQIFAVLRLCVREMGVGTSTCLVRLLEHAKSQGGLRGDAPRDKAFRSRARGGTAIRVTSCGTTFDVPTDFGGLAAPKESSTGGTS